VLEIRIKQQFPHPPGPRYKRQGRGSGEEFRQELLLPLFDQAVKNGEQVTVYLDGAEFGYPTSFIEEAFGGLARLRGIEAVQSTLRFVSRDEPLLEREIRHYIRHAQETPGRLFDPGASV
jgi:hypothetical protein